VWAGPNGLCYFGQGGRSIITESLFTPEQWSAIVPSTIIGARYEKFYVGFYNDGALKGFMVDPLDPKSFVWLTQGARGRFWDPVSERLFIQDVGNTIKRWNHPTAGYLSATFKTGVVRHPYPTNAAYAIVVGDASISCVVTLWGNLPQADGTLAWTQIYTGTVTVGIPFVLPGGYECREFQAQLVTTSPVQGLLIAEEPEDLL
jgi:hypothetical protein